MQNYIDNQLYLGRCLKLQLKLNIVQNFHNCCVLSFLVNHIPSKGSKLHAELFYFKKKELKYNGEFYQNLHTLQNSPEVL